MGFNRRRKRLKIFLILVIIPICMSTVVLVVYDTYLIKVADIEESYKAAIEDFEVQQYMNKRHVYIPKTTIASGTVLNENLFYLNNIIAEIDPNLFMTSADFGCVNLVELKPNLPVMKNIITDVIVSNDIREEEFNMFMLSTHLSEEHFVDVRINFPNGEDYIVLAKKKVRRINLDNNTIWLWLNEEEINRISSGIVDAYLHKGTKLYTVTYVQPAIQKEAEITYPSNLDVINVMENNPNIIYTAKVELAKEQRKALEDRLDHISEDEARNVENSRNQESSTRQQVIQEYEEKEVNDQEGLVEAVEEEKQINDDESEEDDGYFDY